MMRNQHLRRFWLNSKKSNTVSKFYKQDSEEDISNSDKEEEESEKDEKINFQEFDEFFGELTDKLTDDKRHKLEDMLLKIHKIKDLQRRFRYLTQLKDQIEENYKSELNDQL